MHFKTGNTSRSTGGCAELNTSATRTCLCKGVLLASSGIQAEIFASHVWLRLTFYTEMFKNIQTDRKKTKPILTCNYRLSKLQLLLLQRVLKLSEEKSYAKSTRELPTTLRSRHFEISPRRYSPVMRHVQQQ
jgi:hypothetical protein